MRYACLFTALFALVCVGCGQSSTDSGGAVAPALAPQGNTPASLDASPSAPAAGDESAPPEMNREGYSRIVENPFLRPQEHPLSTFSIDVDTASYANVRRFLHQNTLPPADAVRIEELVNYFPYAYPEPSEGEPFAVHAMVGHCPWAETHRLVRVALRGREIPPEARKPCNLVFLLDVSGSMAEGNKLPLVKSALSLLVQKLNENDRVAIVVYAGAAGLVLPSTNGLHKQEILAALEMLDAGGSTNGGEGIQLAYNVAIENLIEGGNNRVILATDGDFNVGTTSEGELTRLIEDKAKSGVYLTVTGYGMGNYQDSTLEKLAGLGNGNYAYIDSLSEAKKVFVEQLSGTLETIAKDVKLQVEFNPNKVGAYRLIGYEDRLLAAQDFRDDKKDAGELGAGHTVTALYEVVPPGETIPGATAPDLRYQTPAGLTQQSQGDELLTLRLRYKHPTGDAPAAERQFVLTDAAPGAEANDPEYLFAAAVAEFGLLLRNSQYAGSANWAQLQQLAASGLGEDRHGYRAEFMDLIQRAAALNAERPRNGLSSR